MRGLRLNQGKLDAREQAVAPNHAAMAPRFATLGQQQNKALGQLTFGFELEPCSASRNIDDCTGTWSFLAIDEQTGVVMELPARLFAQFGAIPKISNDNHRKGPSEPPQFSGGDGPLMLGKVH